MHLLNRRDGTRLTSPAWRIVLALLVALTSVPSRAAKTSAISGIVYTVGSNHVQTVWPNARVSLKRLATNTESSVVTNDLGAYAFTDVLYGDYEISVTLAGFKQSTKSL